MRQRAPYMRELDAIDAALKDVGGNWVHRHSGRGMRGRTCLAVQVPNLADFIFYCGVRLGAASRRYKNVDVQSFANPRSSHIDGNIIAYWPNMRDDAPLIPKHRPHKP